MTPTPKVLTRPQEVFIHRLVDGMTQRQAYLKAYPARKKWKDISIDSTASELLKSPRVQARYQEVLKEMRLDEQSKSKWSRDQSIRSLREVIDRNEQDLVRIGRTYEEELDELQKKVLLEPEKASWYVGLMIERNKERRVSSVHNTGIIGAVSELNRMQGFNEENINLNQSVVFFGEDKLED